MMINELIQQRFGLPTDIGTTVGQNETLGNILARSSCRHYKSDPVSEDLLATLFSVAFSAPSKSDLQQACVLHVKDQEKQQRIAALCPQIGWIARAPVFMVWCGDSRRIRRLSVWRKHAFANDHFWSVLAILVRARRPLRVPRAPSRTFATGPRLSGLGVAHHAHLESPRLRAT